MKPTTAAFTKHLDLALADYQRNATILLQNQNWAALVQRATRLYTLQRVVDRAAEFDDLTALTGWVKGMLGATQDRVVKEEYQKALGTIHRLKAKR